MGSLDAAHRVVVQLVKSLTPHTSEESTPAELLKGGMQPVR